MGQRFALSTDSRLERLSQISEFVEKAARQCGLDEHQVYDVQMAVDEACSNVIEHAYNGKPNGKIEIVCEKRNDEFVVTIRDTGKPFDPSRVAPPKTNVPISERDIGGLGLFFIQKLMDRVHFDFSKNGNRLTMVKRIHSR